MIIAELREQLAIATTAAQQFESMAQFLQDQLTQHRQTSRELNDENDELVNDIHDTTHENDELHKQLYELGRHCNTWRSKYASLRKEKEGLENVLESSREEGDYLDPDEVANFMDEIREQMKRRVREVIGEKSAFERECQRLTTEKRQMRDDLEQCLKEKARLEQRLSEASEAAAELRRKIERDGVEKHHLLEITLRTMDNLAVVECGEVGGASQRQELCFLQQQASHEEELKPVQKEVGSLDGNTAGCADACSTIATACLFTIRRRRRSTGDLRLQTEGDAALSWRQRQSIRRTSFPRNNSNESLDSSKRRAVPVSGDYGKEKASGRQYLSSSGYGDGEELSSLPRQLNPQPHSEQKKGTTSSSRRQRQRSCSFSSPLPIQRLLSKCKMKMRPEPQHNKKRCPLLQESITMTTQNSPRRSHPLSQPPQTPPEPQRKPYYQKNDKQEKLSQSAPDFTSLSRGISKRLYGSPPGPPSRPSMTSKHPPLRHLLPTVATLHPDPGERRR